MNIFYIKLKFISFKFFLVRFFKREDRSRTSTRGAIEPTTYPTTKTK